MSRTAQAVAELCAAINAHDPDRIAACFSEDYRCERPQHPGESFTGRAQVRANYAAMLTAVSGLSAVVLRSAEQDGVHWSEWEMSALTPLGDHVLRRGPVILTTHAGEINWARFYVDPVDDSAERRAFAPSPSEG